MKTKLEELEEHLKNKNIGIQSVEIALISEDPDRHGYSFEFDTKENIEKIIKTHDEGLKYSIGTARYGEHTLTIVGKTVTFLEDSVTDQFFSVIGVPADLPYDKVRQDFLENSAFNEVLLEEQERTPQLMQEYTPEESEQTDPQTAMDLIDQLLKQSDYPTESFGIVRDASTHSACLILKFKDTKIRKNFIEATQNEINYRFEHLFYSDQSVIIEPAEAVKLFRNLGAKSQIELPSNLATVFERFYREVSAQSVIEDIDSQKSFNELLDSLLERFKENYMALYEKQGSLPSFFRSSRLIENGKFKKSLTAKDILNFANEKPNSRAAAALRLTMSLPKRDSSAKSVFGY